ncbi:myelin and lymphocyte protein-like [Ascaphus truei]|uniref:myelin and lymphocyte protein-like n=1 Tax=Ascaphus truei TaxID=8439 RepID=UPI003F5A293A
MEANTAAPVYGDVSALPSGLKVVSSFPDALMIAEIIFGGLVWILVASTDRLEFTPNIQGWVMFVSVTCFLATSLLFILYCTGVHGGKSSWTTNDAFYHSAAALIYLSASVLQAYFVINFIFLYVKAYQENIAAVVFAYLTTVSYVIHAVFSLLRWKRSS